MRPRTASVGLLLEVQACRDRSSRLAMAMGATFPAWRACKRQGLWSVRSKQGEHGCRGQCLALV